MPKQGCRKCNEKSKDPVTFDIQTFCFVVDQSIPVQMFIGIWIGYYRGRSPSWDMLSAL